MRPFRKLAISVILFGIALTMAQAQKIIIPIITPVTGTTTYTLSGTISENTIIAVDTIFITGDVTVKKDVILTIKPSSRYTSSPLVVNVMGNYEIKVDSGAIKANSVRVFGATKFLTYTRKVLFQRNDSAGYWKNNVVDGGWKGITVKGYYPFGDSTLFTGCIFNDIKRITTTPPLNFSNARVKITSCYFNANKFYAVTQAGLLNFISGKCDISSSSFYNNIAPITICLVNNNFLIKSNNIYDNFNGTTSWVVSPSGIGINAGTGFVTGNSIYSNDKDAISVAWNNSIQVDKNYIHDNLGSGLSSYISRLDIYNNVISKNGKAANLRGSYCVIINNSVGNNTTGLAFTKDPLAGSAEIYMYNNIIWNNSASNITGNKNLTIENCILPESSATLTSRGINVVSYKNNLNTDPLFSNATTLDIPDNSIAINAGTTNVKNGELQATDKNNSVRIYHGVIDIGAYEKHIYLSTISAPIIIKTKVIWVADTVKVNANVVIDTSGTLIIAPGTVVSFLGDIQANYKTNGVNPLLCNGNIIARGTEVAPIKFTTPNTLTDVTDPTVKFWKGISMPNGGQDSSIFNYCWFEYALHLGYWEGAALNIKMTPNVAITNSTFQYNRSVGYDRYDPASGAAIAVYQSDIFVNNCKFIANSGSAVFNNSSDMRISNSFFSQNLNQDMQFQFSMKPTISNTIFQEPISVVSSSPEFINCEFYGSTNLASESAPLYYNSVCLSTFSIGPTSFPKFYNSIFKPAVLTSLGASATNCYTDVLNYISMPDFIWDIGNSTYTPANYTRLAIYPSVDKGTTALPADFVLPSTDILGNKRISSDKIDVGAIEHQGSKPVFITHPSSITRCVGENASMTVEVSDTVFCQWQKDGTDIVGATSKTYSIASVASQDEGNYTCRIANGYGNFTCNPAYLFVRTKPEILSNPDSKLVASGTAVNIEVPVSGAKPLTFDWVRNGQSIGKTTNVLNIASFASLYEGTYYLSVTNQCGVANTKNILLAMQPKASILGEDTLYCEGENLELIVNAGSASSYQWYKNGNLIANATSSTLSISKIVKSDEGNYSCLVNILYGKVYTNEIFVSINQNPEILSNTGSQWAQFGDGISIDISANGTKPMQYIWTKNKSVLLSETGAKLIIASFKDSDQGIYKNIVRNKCGVDSTSEVALFVQPLINVLSNKNNGIFCEGDSIRLSLNMPVSATYLWYKDGVALLNATTSTYRISSLTIEDAGVYTCQIKTEYGSFRTNGVNVTVRTLPSIDNDISDTWVNEGSDATFALNAVGSKPFVYSWYKNNVVFDSTLVGKLTVKSVAIANEGVYYTKVKNVCGTVQSTNAALYILPQICLLTADSASGKNTIVWERKANRKIKGYNVYRESVVRDLYEKVGFVSYSVPGVFVDSTSTPEAHQSLYKISVVGANDAVSPMSNYHKTLFLQYVSSQGGVNLMWQPYEIEDGSIEFKSYVLYKGTDPNNLKAFATISSSLQVYTDKDPASLKQLTYYRIRGVLNNACNSQKLLKAGGGPFVESVSNLEDNRLRATGIAAEGHDKNEFAVNIYPQPANSKLTVSYSLTQRSDVEIGIYNLLGVEICKINAGNSIIGAAEYQIDLNRYRLQKGLYYLKLKTQTGSSTKAFVVSN